MGSPWDNDDNWDDVWTDFDGTGWSPPYVPTSWADIGSNAAQVDQLWLQPSFSPTSNRSPTLQPEPIATFIAVTTVFPDLSTVHQNEPSPSSSHRIARQNPRFEGDLYTAQWVRGEGTERAGWCGFCSSWHKLKDSAYNYHMQYTHGVSCQTGKQVDSPQGIQYSSKSCYVLCGACGNWLEAGVGQGDGPKLRTMYFRHAHKCHANPRGRAANRSSPATR